MMQLKLLVFQTILISLFALPTAFPASALERFVDPLPIPPKVRLQGPGTTELTFHERQFQTRYHRDYPATTIWGYQIDGVKSDAIGPTIDVDADHRILATWENDLPTTHLLPPGPKGGFGDASMKDSLPAVRTVTHLHGAVVSEPTPMDKQKNNDGWPDAWITPGQKQVAEYPNHQSARMLWYHDHAMGITARNIYAGLAGTYIIRDAYEKALNLPADDYEIPLIFESKALNDDGSLYYPDEITSDFYGTTVTVNGRIWPYLNVEPRKYRFRILNAGNARTLALKLIDGTDLSTPGPAFYQIGTGSGFLENTVVLNDPSDPKAPRLQLAPAERADVIIDFSKYAGKSLVLNNNSLDDPGDGEIAAPLLMQFRVAAKVSQPDTSQLPMKMRPIARLDASQVTKDRTRDIVFSGGPVLADRSQMLYLNGKLWDSPIEEKPTLGSTEIWQLVNTLPDAHPFHIHLVQFQVLDRTPFDVDHYHQSANHEIVTTGPAQPPEPNEMGWKDTVVARPGAITRIIMRFEPFPGYYVYHCHIAEHEDMGMMRPFQVVGN